MPITKEDLIQFRNDKLKQRELFEEEAKKRRESDDQLVELYKERLFQDYRYFYAIEGGRLDAEIKYLDYLIDNESKKEVI